MGARRGRQTPTFEVVGPYDHTDGACAAGLFENYGIRFYESQEYELKLFLARRADGSFASKTIAISKPRQNGKSFAVRFYALYEAAVEGRRVLYTAHRGRTTRKMFKYIADFVESHPDFLAALQGGEHGVCRSAGYEAIYFDNGGAIEFVTRTNAGGRGDTSDIIVIDEAQELTDDQLDAMKPTTFAAASGDPQMIYIGTPPNEKCPGTVFRRLHDQAHAGESGPSWWLEWAALEIGDRLDRDQWYETNPALGYRIKEETIEDAACGGMSDEGFAREVLGWWSPVATIAAALRRAEWAACRTESPPREGAVCYGIKFSIDGERVALAACVRPEGGTPHVEIVRYGSAEGAIDLLAEWVASRMGRAAFVEIDGKAKSEALAGKLRDAKAPKSSYEVVSTSTLCASCSMLEEAVSAGAVTHFGQPGLDASVRACQKRRVGNQGAWAFGDGADGDADPIVLDACALAYHAAMTTKRRPGRRSRML